MIPSSTFSCPCPSAAGPLQPWHCSGDGGAALQTSPEGLIQKLFMSTSLLEGGLYKVGLVFYFDLLLTEQIAVDRTHHMLSSSELCRAVEDV